MMQAQAAEFEAARAEEPDDARGAVAALNAATMLVGLFAGFFYTYQFSVVRGLAVVDDQTYVVAFQGINDTIKNGWFGIVFFGTAPAILLASVLAAGVRQRVLLTALAFAVATVVITFAGSVPLNNDLGEVIASSGSAASDARADFEETWNMLNLWRTVTSVAAFGLMLVASRLPPSQRR